MIVIQISREIKDKGVLSVVTDYFSLTKREEIPNTIQKIQKKLEGSLYE